LTGIATLHENNLFLTNVHEFFALKPKIVEPVKSQPLRRPLERGIIMDNVSFEYPSGGRKILHNINLHIRPGEHIALVGVNGAGKTTLVKLLCRLYDPTEGAIKFDGIDLRDLSLKDLRREIAVVFQDYARYQLTVRENIWLGSIDLPPQDERVVAAAREAGAHEFIGKLKHKYETNLGKWFDDGEELSIGEWQKIALARAFLRDAQIIILDEPTSALDANAEYEIFSKFHRLAKGRTAILISHRLSTVKMVDSIYVLEEGSIVESGTHHQLVHRGGKYASLFETQAQYYR
jgi:ATP-binding cassette subfamily B protein